MPSIINAATSGGLISTADTSGVLQLQTASTTALTITAAQNVGIGTNSPKSDDGGNKLEISNNANTVVTLTATNDSTPLINFRSNSVDRLQIASSSTFGANFLVRSNQEIRFGTNNTERMRIASDGSVSVGTTSVGGTLNTATSSGNWGALIYDNANNTAMLQFRNNAGAAAGSINLSSAGATTMVLSSVAGVTFPATQVPSADANTLDDYEEGTWTPSVGGTATYSSRSGQYVKIGRTVTVWGQMTISSIGTGSAQAIGGLPFSSIYECTIPVDKSQSLSLAITWIALRVSGTELYAVVRTAASTSGNVNPNYMTNGTEVQFGGTYII